MGKRLEPKLDLHSVFQKTDVGRHLTQWVGEDNIDKTFLFNNADNMQNKTRQATNFIFVWSVNENLHESTWRKKNAAANEWETEIFKVNFIGCNRGFIFVNSRCIIVISMSFVGRGKQTVCSNLFTDANFKINVVKYKKRAWQADHRSRGWLYVHSCIHLRVYYTSTNAIVMKSTSSQRPFVTLSNWAFAMCVNQCRYTKNVTY